MQKGQINVQTENIFPIIKKFLYSDHEIFLRELVSNAVDATQKLKTLSSMGKFEGDLGDLTINVKIDKKAKTLTISDRGIGMTEAEVDKYINQIAFSGAEEFVKEFKGKSEEEVSGIIGHFGLGFYSSFMVSKEVVIETKSYLNGEEDGAVKWDCDGSPNYTIAPLKKEDRGTNIVLHIDDESSEFLEETRILDLLKKYCKFLPVPIRFGDETISEKVEGKKDKDGKDVFEDKTQPRIINNTIPAWTKSPNDLSPEDYKNFYRELYPMNFEEPLFQIHLNVDYPFRLTGILYFPKVKDKFEVNRDKIQLYSNQVFVTDSVEGIVPDFLTLLHGVIDSPDIPLNVSRSYLQSDANVKKISNHITKKVADQLESMFKNERKDFEEKWDDIKIFIEYGIVSDQKFAEKAEKFVLLKSSDNSYSTIEEYKEKVKDAQTDKDKKIVVLYTSDAVEQHSYIQTAKEHGYDVIEMGGVLDGHFIQHLETKTPEFTFKRVDSDVIEKLIQKDEEAPSKLSDEEKEKVRPLFEKALDNKNFTVAFENLSEKEMPAIVTQPEFMRRMKDMQALGGNQFGGAFPEMYNVVINTNHPLTSQILAEGDEAKQAKLVKQTTDLALLAQGLLKGEALTDFVKRSVDLID